jgi:hypothetical protein
MIGFPKGLFSKTRSPRPLPQGLFSKACRPCPMADFTARIAIAQAGRQADACHHSEVSVSRPDHNQPIMAAQGTRD